MPITRHLARCHTLAIHNREAPVSKLPMELLSEIFHIGLEEYDPDDHHAIKYLSTISSICSNWRGTALGTPSLWRCIIYMDYDHDHDPHPNTKNPAIPRHTQDRLFAYLSRSKNCGILLHLRFGANPLRIQAIKRILSPHLPRCLSISLGFKFEPNMKDFLPLQGNLCRLTEFTCMSIYFGVDARPPPPVFAEPGTASLRKLILDYSRPSLDRINVQDLRDVRLMQVCNSWPEGATFISRCHSLTTLVITDNIPFSTDQPFTPFVLPNLIYLDTMGFALLRVAHTPNLQTLVLTDINGDDFRDAFIPLSSWPALTALCVIGGNLISEGFISLLGQNPGIRRLILSACVDIYGIVELLMKDDDKGGAANNHGATLLPALRLLRLCHSWTPHASGFHTLLAHRPTLRIDYSAMCGPISADELKVMVEELREDDEPGVYQRV